MTSINPNHSETSASTPEQPQEHLTRRAALRQAGAMAVGALAGGALLSKSSVVLAQDSPAQTSPNDVLTKPQARGDMADVDTSIFGNLVNLASDVDILNFALILEHLEAEFYVRAVDAHLRRPYLKRQVPELAARLRDDERAHVVAISQRIQELGGTPVAKPVFQFPAEAFISEVAFLDLSGTLEQNGVSAYLGAAPRVKGRGVLRFAASIYGIEARHTAMIRYVSGRTGAPASLETPASATEIATRSAPFIVSAGAMMDGGAMMNGGAMGAAPGM